MDKSFTTKYDLTLKHFVKMTDALKISSRYLENLHLRTVKDKNLSPSEPEAVKVQIEQRADEVDQILSDLHNELVTHEDSLKRDHLTTKDFAKAVKIYRDIFAYGHNPNPRMHASNKQDLLPDIAGIFKLFEWLNNVFETSHSLANETKDTYKKNYLLDLEDQANSALREFRRSVVPFVKAFEKGFVGLTRRDTTVADNNTVGKYQRLQDAIKNNSIHLGQHGLRVSTRTQRELKSAMKPAYQQGHFSNHAVESFFHSMKDILDTSSMKDIRELIPEKLKSIEKRSQAFKRELARTLSYQIDDETGLTVPQRIIKQTSEPYEQEDAVAAILSLNNFGVKFDGRSKTLDTCLHLLKTWHNSLAKVLTLVDTSSSKTAVNSVNRIPLESFQEKFSSSNDPYYSKDRFLQIRRLLNPSISSHIPRETRAKPIK